LRPWKFVTAKRSFSVKNVSGEQKVTQSTEYLDCCAEADDDLMSHRQEVRSNVLCVVSLTSVVDVV